MARSDFSDDEKRVIFERHTGWEKAPASVLAAVFETTPQRITAIIKAQTPSSKPNRT